MPNQSFQQITKHTNMNINNIIGSWKIIEAEVSLDLGKNDEMEFKDNGFLIYAIDAGSKWQIMQLTYRIEGNFLVTDQPSAPNIEKTKIQLENDNILVLDYDGAVAKYKRIDQCTFID